MAAITQLSMLAPVVSQHPLLDTACHMPLCPQPGTGDLLLGKPRALLLQGFTAAEFSLCKIWAKISALG